MSDFWICCIIAIISLSLIIIVATLWLVIEIRKDKLKENVNKRLKTKERGES